MRGMASHPSQPTIATYIFWIESLEKNIYQRMESQPFKQRLQRIQFGKLELRESNSNKSPKSTTVYDIHSFKNQIFRQSELRDSTSHPSQPLFTKHIF